MGRLIFIELLMILALPFGPSGGAKLFIGSAQQPACTECHSDLLDHGMVHYPVTDACDNCHESTGAAHPSDDSLGFRLMDKVPELCFYCHEAADQKNSSHLPYTKGECLSCHDAHGSSGASLLRYPDPDLCLGCHKRDFRADSTETLNIRRLVSGSMNAHSAIAGGGCRSCHRAHVSEFRVLLAERYPEEDYLPALTGNFELCFLCHDTDLLNARETEWGTGFRNGTSNLHWLHMNGDKGRNCRLCHNLHGSPLPFLVEEQVAFGRWEMRLNFIPEEQGGSCQPGCHGKLSYRR